MPRWSPGFLVAIVLALGVPLLWVWLQSSPADSALRFKNGKLVGDVTGYLAGLDDAAQQLRVSLNRFGLRPFVFLLTGDTVIVVHGKLGGVGDLEHVLSVRVGYEVRDGIRIATSIQVGDAEAPVIEPLPAAVAPKRSPPVKPATATTAGGRSAPPLKPIPLRPPGPPLRLPAPPPRLDADVMGRDPLAKPQPPAPSSSGADGAAVTPTSSTPGVAVRVEPPVDVTPALEPTPIESKPAQAASPSPAQAASPSTDAKPALRIVKPSRPRNAIERAAPVESP